MMLRNRWQRQCSHNSWLGAIAVVWLLLAMPGHCEAGKPIPADTAIPIIETLENRIQVAQWRAEGISGKMLDFNNLDSIEVPPERRNYKCKWQVTFEPQSGRYRADMETVAGWKDGDASSAASVESFSNENATQRYYQRASHGQKIPSAQEGVQNGEVIFPQANAFMDRYGCSSGIAFVPPYFYGCRLSDYLRERIAKKQLLTILQNEKGIWQIDTVPPKVNFAEYSTFRITYDPSRGIVLGAEWIGTPDALYSANKPWARCVIQWAQAEAGVWVPTAQYYYNLLDHSATRLVFQEMRVNQKVDDSVFRFVFPPNTYVTDYVEKKLYRTITGVVDEQDAIRNFMEWEKLRDTPPSTNRHLSWIIIINCGVLIAISLLLWWRKRKGIIAKLLLFISIFASPLARAADIDEAGNWIVSHSPGESIRISHCGLNVTMFTMEYYRTAYRVKQVAASLPPPTRME